MPSLSRYLSLVEGSTDLQAIQATVYHGSPARGIKRFDPEKGGSNTGAKDAKQGFFFFATSRSAESYLEQDEDLKPELRTKYDTLMQQAKEHQAAFVDTLTKDLTAAGVDVSKVDLTSDMWLYKLPADHRDQFRGYADRTRDHYLARHLTDQAHELMDRSANLTTVLNGAVYQCRITLEAAYVTDMDGAAYTPDSYGRLIRFARTNFSPDGIVLHNVLDSEVGRRDTVYIVFDERNIEIVDSKAYDDVPVAHRAY